MLKILLTFCAVLSILELSGQYTQTVTPVMEFGLIEELHLPPAETKGSVYLNENWIESDIYLKKGVFSINKLDKIPVKLNLKTNALELQTGDGIKVLESSKIDKFLWTNLLNNQREEFSPCHQFAFNGTSLSGFCKITGTAVKLITRNYVEINKANYNVALDVGSREDQIIKKYKLYLFRDNELIECSKKSIYAVMADKADRIKHFVKKNHLRFNEEDDVRAVIDYYNSN